MSAPLYYTLPPDAKFRACHVCGTMIAFVTTESGRLMPVDKDGRSHYQTCTDPQRFSRTGQTR